MKVLYVTILALCLVGASAQCTNNGATQSYAGNYAIGPVAVHTGDTVANDCICMPWDDTPPPQDDGSCVSGIFTTTLWKLKDHPGGYQAPPTYGLRLDGFTDDGGRAITTYSFGYDIHTQVYMEKFGENDGMHIFGVAYGGKDNGVDESWSSDTGYIFIDFYYPTSEKVLEIQVTQDRDSAGYYIYNNDAYGIIMELNNDQAYHNFTVDARPTDNLYYRFTEQVRGHAFGGEGWIRPIDTTTGTPWTKEGSRDFLFTAECATDSPLASHPGCYNGEEDPFHICSLLNRECGDHKYTCGACISGTSDPTHGPMGKCA